MAARPIRAAAYDLVAGLADSAWLGPRRQRLLAAARGRVLEVGGGTGRNLAHYGGAATVTVVEPDPARRKRLRAAAARPAVEVVDGALEGTDLTPGSFDTVVCVLVLCRVADPAATLRRIRGLLAPGGRLLFLEHVAGGKRALPVQRALTPLWQRVSAGCHLDRHTTLAMREAGFVITDCERLPIPPRGLLAGHLVQGSARADVRAPGGQGTRP